MKRALRGCGGAGLAIALLLVVAGAGCRTAGDAGVGGFASVTIPNHTEAEVISATAQEFVIVHLWPKPWARALSQGDQNRSSVYVRVDDSPLLARWGLNTQSPSHYLPANLSVPENQHVRLAFSF